MIYVCFFNASFKRTTILPSGMSVISHYKPFQFYANVMTTHLGASQVGVSTQMYHGCMIYLFTYL